MLSEDAVAGCMLKIQIRCPGETSNMLLISSRSNRTCCSIFSTLNEPTSKTRDGDSPSWITRLWWSRQVTKCKSDIFVMLWRIGSSIDPRETSPPWICATATRKNIAAWAMAIVSNRSPSSTIISGEILVIASAKPIIARPVDFAVPTPLLDKTSISTQSLIGILSFIISARLALWAELRWAPVTSVSSSKRGCSFIWRIRFCKMP